ncbi:MAG: hypothetical protein CM1200mP29_02890 [Verrucomicrobiota bacterium]|nr:MAG: hypothetical protein CM1200mP29_02890 [Verrucomicrobiota bacterium]
MNASRHSTPAREMDGFDTQEGIIIIAAPKPGPDVLDPACCPPAASTGSSR